VKIEKYLSISLNDSLNKFFEIFQYQSKDITEKWAKLKIYREPKSR
jgi:hypothetical protein